MRKWMLAATATCALALTGAVAPAKAMPAGGFGSAPHDIEQVQYFFGGQNYCWYPDGWRGPGFYWCGYAWRRGFGWGGGYGWRGWHPPGGPGWRGRPPGGPGGWHGGRPPGGPGGGGPHGAGPGGRPPGGGGRPPGAGGRPPGGGGNVYHRSWQ